MVVEVMLYTIYLLVVLMSLSGNEDNIALLCHHGCRADSFLAVNNRQNLLALCGIKPGEHVVDNCLWLFVTWIVACEDDFVALLDSFLCHQRTFALVTMTAGTTYGNDMSALVVKYVMDGAEDVLQCVRCMCIVNYCRESFRRLDGFQSSVDTLQCAQCNQYVFRLLA